MDKDIDRVEIKKEDVVIHFKKGGSQKAPVETTYTYYKDGSNDCTVKILEPLRIKSKNNQEEK